MTQTKVAQEIFSRIWMADSDNFNVILAETLCVCMKLNTSSFLWATLVPYFLHMLVHLLFLFKIKWYKYPDINGNGTLLKNIFWSRHLIFIVSAFIVVAS